MNDIILVGAGGHSVSVVDSAIRAGFNVCGFIDEYKHDKTFLDRPIFSPRIQDIENYNKYLYFIAIGDVHIRKRWFEKLQSLELTIPNIIDPSAIVSDFTEIGTGNFIGKMAIVVAGSKIGNNNLINSKALIEHRCTIGEHTNLSTGSIINGEVVVEDGVYLGSGAICNGQIKLGKYSVVGSGSVVLKDVEPFTTVVGVPAKIIKRNGE